MPITDWRGLTVFSRTTISRAQEAVAALKAFMRDCESNRLLLLTIVTQGKTKFMNVLRDETRGLAIDDAMLERVWGWLEARKGAHPEQEREWLELDQRDRQWKEQAISAEMQRIEIAAKHNLRLKGDQHFDGEKITTGVGDSRLD